MVCIFNSIKLIRFYNKFTMFYVECPWSRHFCNFMKEIIFKKKKVNFPHVLRKVKTLQKNNLDQGFHKSSSEDGWMMDR